MWGAGARLLVGCMGSQGGGGTTGACSVQATLKERHLATIAVCRAASRPFPSPPHPRPPLLSLRQQPCPAQLWQGA